MQSVQKIIRSLLRLLNTAQNIHVKILKCSDSLLGTSTRVS